MQSILERPSGGSAREAHQELMEQSKNRGWRVLCESKEVYCQRVVRLLRRVLTRVFINGGPKKGTRRTITESVGGGETKTKNNPKKL